MRRRLGRRDVVAGATAVVAACFPLLTVHPAEAASETVVLDVPRSDRWDPRNAGVLGATGAGLVYIRENDPGLHLLGGGSSILLRAPDGTETPLQTPSGDGAGVRVLGDRIVLTPAASDPTVASRVLPDGAWESLPLPSGYDVVDYTGDGVLLSDGPWGDERLSLLPWTGGEPLPITGLPAGRVVHGPFASDATGVVLSAPSAQGAAEPTIYVDTTSRQAWVLPLGDQNGSNWSIAGETLAWTSLTEARETLIRTMPRPVDGEPLEPVATRPGPPMPMDTFRMALLPVGQDVVVSRDLPWFQWGRDVEGTVAAVHPDGSTTDLLAWGHDIRSAGAGSIVAVAGPNPQDSALVRVDVATGATTELAALPPVPARTTQVAVDGNRLVYVDDSGSFGAAAQRQVTFDPGAVGQAQILGSPARQDGCSDRPSIRCSTIAAANGATAWVQGYGARTDDWRIRAADGADRTGELPERSITAVSGPWALLDARKVLDTRTGTRTVTQPYGGADLVNGVLYQRADAIETSPDKNIAILRDLTTGASGSVTAPSPCVGVGDVEAAGSWLLLRCSTAEPYRAATVVVDRTGATPTWEADVPVRLGNGFVVHQEADGTLAWASLKDTEHTWHVLGTARPVGGTFSVSKGGTPTVAWADPQGQAHIVLLPVATSAPAARPTGPSAPTAPARLTAVTDYRQTLVGWEPSAPSERVTGYIVTRQPGSVRRVLPPDATSIDFFDLTNGTPYTYTVTAQNLGGTSAEASITATPGDPPPPPPDVVAPTVDAPTVPAVQLASSTMVRLSGQDEEGYGYVDFDTRWRSASTGNALGAWTYPAAWRRRVEQQFDVTGLVRGHTYCFSARSRDAAGNTSAWSPARCTTVALDDRVMTRSGTWRLPRAKAYYQGTATSGNSTRAALRLDAVRADAAWLVATRCPTCGSLAVYDDGRLLGTVDLRTRRHQDRRVLELPWHGGRTGRLTLRVKSGTPVVDGMALRSYRP
jgi:hypothetical protein